MDQFRQVGEVMGSLKALMVLKHEISINQRQCCLLVDIMELAFETISEEMGHHLRLEDKNTKWKALELPMKELHRVFKEADLYIRHCMDIKDWWGKAISLHMNRDCVELHIHNLLCCFPVVIEAIETAAEISGVDEDDMQKRRSALMHKYEQECDDLEHFRWKFGKQYLVPREICSRLQMAWREDRWLLGEKIGEKKMGGKNEQRLGELLLRKINDGETSKGKLMPSNILVGAQDYFVKRRLGSGYPSGGGHVKEIHWMGENFALRTFIGDIAPFHSEISSVLSVSHPNVLQYLCAFYDEDRKEGFLVMELMSKDLGSYIKEHSGQRNRIPFSLPVAVDIMLQIARGMEYLHTKKICHGVLNPSNILLKAKNASIGGFQAKVSGFGLNSIKSYYAARSPKQSGVDLDIWLAPEVLAELEQGTTNYTEKADVYSFGMVCFELLTGKVPFEDSHLQGEQMARNIRAGERPLFSYPSPKYFSNLTKKCWQSNPNQRPTFSSICRILRYIKKILIINPDHGDPDSAPPLVDYCDMEAGYLKKFPGGDSAPVFEIPFQMFSYKIVEKEKICSKKWDLTTADDDHLAAMDDLLLAPSDERSVFSEIIDSKNSAVAVDMRSVISETPQHKLYPLNRRSFGSESPRKILTSQKLKVEVPDKAAIAFKGAQSLPATPMPQENSKKPIEIPEKKILQNAESIQKKPMHIRKLKNIKTNNAPETSKFDSPKSSPLRMKKKKPRSSPASSPARAFKNDSSMPSPGRLKITIPSSSPASSPSRVFKKSNDSPMSSPARMKKTIPASLPSRAFATSASPRHSKEYSSPIASPMHPSVRSSSSSRLSRQSSLPATMSRWQRPKVDHVWFQVA